jgi:hypothetical protein
MWAIWARGTGRPTVTPSAAVHGSGQQTFLPPSTSDSFEVRFLSFPVVIQTLHTDNMVCI